MANNTSSASRSSIAATEGRTTIAPISNSVTGVTPQQPILGNDGFIREVINSPMVQNILSNPDVLRTMFAENPQFQQVIQVNF